MDTNSASGILKLTEVAQFLEGSIDILREHLYTKNYPEDTQTFFRDLIQRLGKAREPFNSNFGRMILMAAEDMKPSSFNPGQDKIKELVLPLLKMSLEPDVAEGMRQIQIKTAIELLEGIANPPNR